MTNVDWNDVKELYEGSPVLKHAGTTSAEECMSKEALKARRKAQPIDSIWKTIADFWATSTIRRQAETTSHEKCLVSTGVCR